jgi:hypothetical protein
MEEVIARAELVALPDATASNAVTIAIPRRDIETALAAEDGPMDLVLDVTRAEDTAEQPAELRKIAISWEPEQLEQLLQRADGEIVTVVFDGEGIVRLVDPDFELHGMREGLAVIAAAVAVGAAAAAANAAPVDEGAAGGSSGAAYTAVEQARTGATVAPVDIESARSAATAYVAPASGADIEAVRSAEPLVAADASAASGAASIEAVRSAEPLVAADSSPASAAGGIEAVRSAEPMPGSAEGISAAGSIEAVRSAEAAPAISAAEGIEATRSAEAASAGAQSVADDGITISMPSPQTIALFGGLALLITGAAFVSRGRRPVLPA